MLRLIMKGVYLSNVNNMVFNPKHSEPIGNFDPEIL